jgi:hypothetical protein
MPGLWETEGNDMEIVMVPQIQFETVSPGLQVQVREFGANKRIFLPPRKKAGHLSVVIPGYLSLHRGGMADQGGSIPLPDPQIMV